MKQKQRKKGKLQTKFLLGLLALAVVLSLALGTVITQKYRSSMERYYAKVAFDEAKIAADTIDGDTIPRYAQTLTKDNYYNEINKYLLRIKSTVGLKYFYVVIPYEDQMYYIWDAGTDNEGGICEIGTREDYYGGGREIMRGAFLNPGEETILITNNEEYGYLASAYVAILDSAGNAVGLSCVDVSMDMINEQISGFIAAIVLIIVGVMLLFVVGYFFMIRLTVLRPIYLLNRAASTITSEEVEALSDFTVGIQTGDELESLSEAFEHMARDLYHYITNLTAVTAEKERIGAELNVATHIQSSMLPCIFPAFPTREEFDIYATMQPAKEVGGDFYDFFLIDNDHLAVVMADVSGKGVPAALFMVIAKTLIKNYSQAGLTPADVFTAANRQLCENNEAGLFVTAWMGVLEISTGKFTYVNAGHNPPLIKRHDGKFEYLKCRPGFVLAGMEDIKYRQNELELHAGDTIYLYTDGVTEATDTLNALYGEERLQKILNQNASVALVDLLPIVRADIDLFVKGAPQFDDITMLGLRISGGK
ncbi:PP2C family protein-serine/threonine phosphatase [Oscillospiraceae bacterium LTW-04]|nr:SpoIIE family protein phosphatase [Oscillospiraceae bacterium MB24-C1]